ncbi:MAG: nucleoside triphosphate pyrophosphohydrolase [Pseudomonadota bacterium]
MDSIEKLLEIMAQLRDPRSGCPWDREQTYASIAPYTIEEAYEVADVIAQADYDGLQDELGDLLFQVVFLSRIAEEEGRFAFGDVAAAIAAKLTRRHPHVFADADPAQFSDAEWERIKGRERTERDPEASVLDGIPAALPALKRAQKMGKRAATVGFDWPESSAVRAKVDEELAELDAAVNAGSLEAAREELGDVLFSLVNLARHLGIDAEQALSLSNGKFAQRFRGMEAAAGREETRLSDLDLDRQEALWEAQKGR